MNDGWKRIFGIDVVNSVLVAAGSFAVVIFTGELTGSGEMAMGAMVLCIGGYGILRHYGLKTLPEHPESSGAWRVAELEERLDFTERMLAAKGEPARIEGPKS